jgi:hypothetical protein
LEGGELPGERGTGKTRTFRLLLDSIVLLGLLHRVSTLWRIFVFAHGILTGMKKMTTFHAR